MTDLKHAPSSHLRLCTTSETETDVETAPEPTQDQLIRAIEARGIVPAELDSLCDSLPVAAEMGHRLAQALEDAVHRGRLNIIYTHGAWHMASPDLVAQRVRDRGARALDSQIDVQSALPAPTTADATEDQQRFQLAVLLDAAHEKALLFRVLIVLNVVGAMLLLREIFQ